MQIRFFPDPDGDPHVWAHGVLESEVREAFARRVEDRRGDGDTRLAIGSTNAGRLLRVIYTRDKDGDGVFVITAYDLTGKPLAAFRRRRKKRGR